MTHRLRYSSYLHSAETFRLMVDALNYLSRVDFVTGNPAFDRTSKAARPLAAGGLLCSATAVFLLVYSARSAVKANWTLPAYFSLLVAAYPGYRYLSFNSGPRVRAGGSLFLLVWFCALPIIYTAALFHSMVPLPGVAVHRWATGWREMGRIVAAKPFESQTGRRFFSWGLDYSLHRLGAFFLQQGRSSGVFPKPDRPERFGFRLLAASATPGGI